MANQKMAGKKASAKTDDNTIGDKLTLKQRRFINAYIANGGNATDAARQAGYKQTPEALRVTACRMLTKANIQSRIAERLAEDDVTADEVKKTLASQMRADVTDLFNDNGGFDLQTIKDRKIGHLIKKVKVRREWERGTDEEKIPVDVIELEVHSSQAAAQTLAKVLGIEQNPRENQIDFEAVKQGYERQISYLIANSKDATTRQQAIAKIAEHEKVSGGEVKILKFIKE
jgi:phage terminase small subunit